MFPPAFGVALFITSFVIARIVHERALRRLSTEEKGRLVEAFSSHRIVMLLPIAAMAAMYFAVSRFDLPMGTFLSVYIPAVLLFAAGSHVYVFRKLREIECDPEFIRQFGLSRVISLLGFASLLPSL